MSDQLILLATTIIGFVYTAYREARTRRWASEERKQATLEIVETAKAEAEVTRIKNESIADAVKVEAAQVALKLEQIHLATALSTQANSIAESEKIRAKLEEVKTAAHEAYKEANDVNVKIANLNDHLVKQGEHLVKQSAQQEIATAAAAVIVHIEEQGIDTNTRVRTIEAKQAEN